MQTKLAKYIAKAGLKRKEFAVLAGLEKEAVSRFANGHGRPGLEIAVRIEEATRGAIPPRYWVKEWRPRDEAKSVVNKVSRRVQSQRRQRNG